MRRLLALVLVQAMVVSTSMAASVHVHEYSGHDHPDHHHGPAAHDHHQPATADRDHHEHDDDADHPVWQADPCDPGRHAAAVSMSCACVPQVHVDVAEEPGPALVFRARRLTRRYRSATSGSTVRRSVLEFPLAPRLSPISPDLLIGPCRPAR